MKTRKGMDHKHCKWPLGLKVMVKTPQGYLKGKVHKHDQKYGSKASVDFSPAVVDMGNECGARHCHIIPFRSMKPLPRQPRPKFPWYKTPRRNFS